MLRTFIQTTALIVTLLASFFWIRGSLILSVRDMAALSGTYWDYNLHTLRSLASQKADSLMAGLLLLFSFLLQFFNATWTMRICDWDVNKRGIIASVIFSLSLSIICYLGAPRLTEQYYLKAKNIVGTKKVRVRHGKTVAY